MSSVKEKCEELSKLSYDLKREGELRNPSMFATITYPYLEDHPELLKDELSSFYNTTIRNKYNKLKELSNDYKKIVILEIVDELHFIGFEIGYDLTNGEDIYSFKKFKEIFYGNHEYILSGTVKAVVDEALGALNDAVLDLTPFWEKTSKIYIGETFSWFPARMQTSIEYIKSIEVKISEVVLENNKIKSKIIDMGKRLSSFEYETNIDFVGKGTNLASRNRLDLSNMLESGERSLIQHEKLREVKEKK